MFKHKIKKLTLLFCLFFLLIGSARAQGNLPYIDDKLFHFGFSLGINNMDFEVTSSQLKDSKGRTYFADVSNLKPGFSVGIVTDLRLNRYLNLRFTPNLHFGERELRYTYGSGVVDSLTLTISSIPVHLPIYLKYSAERKGNFRPYVLAGMGASFDLGRNKENPVLLNPIDFYSEVGIGCDIYFSFFKLSPELKLAVGMNNMLTPIEDRNSAVLSERDKFLSNALSKLTSRMLTLTFNFE